MQKFAILTVGLLLISSLSLLLPVGAQEEPQIIGWYERTGGGGELTEDDLVLDGDSLHLESPALASSLQLDMSYLKGRLGDWSYDRSFTTRDGQAIFSGQDVTFSPFVLDSVPQFTSGSSDSVEFLGRPMWLSANPDGRGGLKVEMDDGDPTGQNIFLAKSWLAAYGTQWPVVQHEDRSALEVRSTPEYDGFIVEVPHFSFVIISPSGLDVKGRTGGVVVPHSGEVRYYQTVGILEIDVEEQLTDYDVLVGKEWIDERIPRPEATPVAWVEETVDGTMYYVVALVPSQTPLMITATEAKWPHYNFTVNLTQMEQDAGSGNFVVLPVDPNENVTLTFDPVERSVYTFDPNITEADVRHYKVNQSAGGENASGQLVFTMSDGVVTAASGDVCVDDVAISYSGPGHKIINALPRTNEVCLGQQVDYPYQPPPPPTTRDVGAWVLMDPAFVNQFPDNEETAQFDLAMAHVEAALLAGYEMWNEYSGNLDTWSIYLLESEVSGTPTCPSSTGSGWIVDVSEWFDNNERDEDFPPSDPNPRWLHVTGKSPSPQGCLGTAWAREGQLPARENGFPRTDAWATGKDIGAYHGFSSSEHLGKLLAEEVGHNWGEPEHGCEPMWNKYSTMCNNDQWGNRKEFWIHYNDAAKPANARDSRQFILDGTSQYD